jgi:uncharacterized protein (DUF2267 family)
MNETAEFNPQKDDQELMFFRSLKTEMQSLTTRKILKVVRVVLTSAAKSLPATQVVEITKKLPSTLQLIFMSCWESKEDRKSGIHLDELVDKVCQQQTKKGVLFTNEIDALKYILIVIRNLKLTFDKIGVSVFPYSMIAEYQQAVQEEAV